LRAQRDQLVVQAADLPPQVVQHLALDAAFVGLDPCGSDRRRDQGDRATPRKTTKTANTREAGVVGTTSP
jgi:hypothetical protein